eukprot:30185-Eustigmatos_ZCMA.PRE.1
MCTCVSVSVCVCVCGWVGGCLARATLRRSRLMPSTGGPVALHSLNATGWTCVTCDWAAYNSRGAPFSLGNMFAVSLRTSR